MSDLKEWMNPLVPADTRVQIADGEVERLRAELARVTAQRDAILMQARIWSGEAKAQKATVDAVGEILGGVPDWGPIAQGVEQLRADLAASQAECERLRDGDTCARQCEGTAYRIEAQKFRRALEQIAAMPHARDAYIVAVQALDRPLDAARAGKGE